MTGSDAHKLSPQGRRLAGLAVACRRSGRLFSATFALSAVAWAFPARAGVAIYQDVFEGGMEEGYSYETGNWERRFQCYAYGPWGSPMLAFRISCELVGNRQTTTLIPDTPPWPIVELNTSYPEFGDYDTRAAWFITTTASTIKKVSVSNTVFSSTAVFSNHNTGQNLTVEPYTFSGLRTLTKTLYLCFGHPSGQIVGWVKINIRSDEAWIESSCIAMGVYALQIGSTEYEVWPATLLEGGIRQLDIYVDGSAAGGTGLSWDSPFRTIQEAVDAVRLDGTTVHVRPGVYGVVAADATKFTANNLAYTFTVESTDGPTKTIIDGGERGALGVGTRDSTKTCFSCAGSSSHLYYIIKGFTLCNALYGVQSARPEHCIVSNCWYGLYHTTASNCLVTKNKFSTDGSYCNDLRNCTVVGNYEITPCWASNSIIWDFYLYGYTTNAFKETTHCCVPAVGKRGTDNISLDPLFVDAAVGDYRLRPDSPCIDAGIGGTEVGATDLSGGIRVRGGGIDIGCFEFVPTVADTNATDGVSVPPEWLEAHYGLDRAASPDAAYQAASLAETANPRDGTAAGRRLLAWESYLWDLDPTNSSQYAHAEIEVVNGAPRVQIVPSSPNRTYTLLGKASLNAQNWARSPDLADADFLSTNRFFKVSVEPK